MLKMVLITSAMALAFGGGLTAAAWQSSPQTAPQAGATPAAAEGTMVHIEGCLFPEGGPAVRAQVDDDYNLTVTKLIAGPEDATETGRTLRLSEADGKQLRDLSGKKVGVTGRVRDGSGQGELAVTSIREIVGGCTSMPRS